MIGQHGLIREKCVGWCRELDPRFCKFLLTLINKTANINSMLSTTKQELCDQNIITAITINQLLSLMSQIIRFHKLQLLYHQADFFAHHDSNCKWMENCTLKIICIIGSKKMKKWHECKSYVRLNVGERVKNIEWFHTVLILYTEDSSIR